MLNFFRGACARTVQLVDCISATCFTFVQSIRICESSSSLFCPELSRCRRSSRVDESEESVYQRFLGGYGLGAWLMMDNIDAAHVLSERERDEQKQAVLDERAARWEAERRERDAKLQRKQEQRDDKARLQVKKERKQRWRRWRYAFGTSRPVARIKGGLRLLFGGRH